MSQTETSLRSLAAENTGEIWIALVTIRHPNLATPFRLALENQDVTSRGNVFLGRVLIDVALMSDDEQIGGAALRIANDLTVVEGLQGLNPVPQVDIEYVLASDPDTVITSNLSLTLRSFSATVGMLEGRLEGPSFLKETVPGVNMNRANTPALYG